MDATVDAGHEVCVAEVAGVVEQRDVGLPVEASYMIIFTCIMYIYIHYAVYTIHVRYVCTYALYAP